MTGSQAHAAVEAVVRMESARLIAGLARYTGDVGLAEELAQDAVVAALEQWPEAGVPRNPGAWLMTVAKRRAIDLFRRNKDLQNKYAQIGRALEAEDGGVTPDFDAAFDDHIDDDMLRLMFIACHPILPPPARSALTLRLLGGLTTAEIARAYLVPETTIAQRIVRAKKTLAKAKVPFEVPGPDQRPDRLAAVLEVIYLIFNEGYSATAGDDWMRPALCEEAVRLGRVLAQLTPDEPEVHGLLALMEIQASRVRARTGQSGEPVLLLDQDRRRWDRLLINRGLAALERAGQLGGARGPYALQAAIAACHARAFRPEDTDWVRITRLYATLAEVMPSPVIELNRAVAVSMAHGPQAGLDVLDSLAGEPSLRGYHLLPSVRGDLLMKLGRPDEARREFERAAALTRNLAEREMTEQRARQAAARSRGRLLTCGEQRPGARKKGVTIERANTPLVAGEREMLTAWLDWQRATLAGKCDGLSDDQLRERAVPPSTLSLLGLIRHMTEVERNWFRPVLGGEPPRLLWSADPAWSDKNWDAAFDEVDKADAGEAFGAWRAECANARALTSAAESLDVTGMRRGSRYSLRWVMVHMIEEYARHNGHADLLRERIDGQTGY